MEEINFVFNERELTDTEVANLKADEKVPIGCTGECKKCGKCCEFVNCEHLDKKTRLCKIYEKRPVVCRMHPCHNIEITEVDCPGYKSENAYC